MHPVEKYFKDIGEIRSTGGGVPETSYYHALETLLNEIGKKLKPNVRCVSQLADTGAGSPDFGLYSADQFQKFKGDSPLPGQNPERGVIEVKPIGDDAWRAAKGEQVTRYWGKYGQILVTNFRDFLFIGNDEKGNPKKLDSFSIADSENVFWAAVNSPRKTANEIGDRLIDYLKRVMLQSSYLSSPEDVAWFLASYAREARERIGHHGNLSGLKVLRNALEDALGMKFRGEDGENFFRATLIQTLFYGIFSFWVIWAKDNSRSKNGRFNWHDTAWNLHVPMIAVLFQQLAQRNKLKPLGIDQVLDWTEMVLNRVLIDEFFEKFEDEHAVLYFYEPFLKAYDPKLRKDLGVWYTPPEIVKYQVERVDTVLREELNIEDGLADDNVYILDPCCGTGAYLLEVIKKIYETLKNQNGDATTALKLKKAALNRVFGFEILPAPFVVSHLQLGLLLKNLGVPLLEDADERISIFLTNALTGWEPPKSPKDQFPFPELQYEREQADKIKRDVPIIVILGNPPYNAFAGTSPAEEQGLVEPYKKNLTKPVEDGGWGIKKFNLDDLYVRFFRIAERRIDKSGKGVVSYISNFSYLDDSSFVVMRQNLLNDFNMLWFDCMNGDSRETGKLTPEGDPDPSVFSTKKNSVGIKVGTAISTIVRKSGKKTKPQVHFRHFWGVNKKDDLLKSLKSKNIDKDYQTAKPDRSNRYSFRPSKVSRDYISWPSLLELSKTRPFNGLMEKRRGALIDIDKNSLSRRMEIYFDSKIDWDAYKLLNSGLTNNAASFNAEKMRKKAISEFDFKATNIKRYFVRPFDKRYCYYSELSGLWNRNRPSFVEQLDDSRGFLVSRPKAVAIPEGVPFFYSNGYADDDSFRGHGRCYPFRLLTQIKNKRKDKKTADLMPEYGPEKKEIANLSASGLSYLKSLGIENHKMTLEYSSNVWLHSLAIGYSPAYLSENADGIRQDWPRIPLPNSKKALLKSAGLGRQVSALLDIDNKVSGVSSGKIHLELNMIGKVSKANDGNLSIDEEDLDMTAGWGHAGKNNVTMPGKGKIVNRQYTKKELQAIKIYAKEIGSSLDDILSLVGNNTNDVYLNDNVYWKNIPSNVWNYYIGGYQVIKKWLSYREKPLLGRSMTLEEVEYVKEMAHRLAAIILFQPSLNQNYSEIKSNIYSWPVKKDIYST